MHAFEEHVNKNIHGLRPYQPGKPTSELARELGLTDIIKLASNENPLGPSAKAVASATKALAEGHIYPDGSGYDLRQTLAKHINIDAAQLTLGNGSDSLFLLTGQVFVNPGEQIISSQHAFAAYKIVSQVLQADFCEVPAKDWGFDLDAIANAVTDKTRLIFIANPNNPTGTWVTHQQLTDFMQKIPAGVIVLLDEAYYEYVNEKDYPDGISLQQKHPNLIITRTFSKIHALAGLRLGYAISHPQIADYLNRVRFPFNVSSPALAAAISAIEDTDHVEKSQLANRQGAAQLREALDKLGINYLLGLGNFITLDLKQDAMPMYDKLLTEGIITRPIANYGMPQHLRVTIGETEENERFISALQKML